MDRLSHIVFKYSLRAGKSFFPNGHDLPIRSFQSLFYTQAGKIRLSEDLMLRYGLQSMVFLGRQPLSDIDHVATYLYENAIHPEFFAEALYVFTSHAKVLEPVIARVQLGNLKRENIADKIRSGAIVRSDIGEHFNLFAARPAREKLEILIKLGVLVLKEHTHLPSLTPPQSTAPITPPLLALMGADNRPKNT